MTSSKLPLLYTRLTALFLLQGIIILVFYAFLGFDTHPNQLPFGLRLDPLHAVIHLLIGVAGGYIGFWKPGLTLRFLQVFGALYFFLAVMGTFTDVRFGLFLELEENIFHWTVGSMTTVFALIAWKNPQA